MLAFNILLGQGRVSVGCRRLLFVDWNCHILYWLVCEVIVWQSQVFWDFEFLIIINNIMLTWQNKWMTLPPLYRFLLVLEEVRGGNLLSEVVHERSCGFGLGKSHICFEALTIIIVAMWRRHRCHLTTHFVKIDLLPNRMAYMTSHHRWMIGWRVCLRKLVLIVELLWHGRFLYTLGHFC